MTAISRPFPIQLEVEFLDRLSEPVREGRAASVSAIIRAALERYDFSNIVVVHPAQVSISVRLAPEIRRNLKQISRMKHTSVGQLVRAAVEAYLPQIESGQLEMPDVPAPTPAVSVLAPPRPRARRAARKRAAPKKTTKTKTKAKGRRPRRA